MTEQFEVYLYVYDLSKGSAKVLSSLFLGKELPAIWHTAIIAYDREYFFGSGGINSCVVGATNLGQPDRILSLGRTEVPYDLFMEYLFTLDQSIFKSSSYNIFENNCNNFSDAISSFLTGRGIPEEILNLPNEFLTTPLGQALRPFFDSIAIQPNGEEGAAAVSSHNYNPHFSTVTKVEPKNVEEDPVTDESSKRSETNLNSIRSSMADEQTENLDVINDENDGDENETSKFVSSRKAYKFDDPPIVFKDIDGITALAKVEEMVQNFLNPQQQQCLKEIEEYLKSETGAWAIGDEHLDLFSFLLNGGDGKFAPNVTLLTLEVLQAASLKEDVVLILHQDRKDHRIMSYINKIENLTLAEQEEIVKLLCNLCGQPSTIDWLLYISEWTEENGHSNSNSRVTIRAAVHTLLNDQLTTLQRNGVYLIYNLSLKEVFEDVSIELSTAILQYMHSNLPDDQVIVRFMEISANDVPALIKMLGPDLNKFKNKNDKMDNLVKEIENRVAKLPSYL